MGHINFQVFTTLFHPDAEGGVAVEDYMAVLYWSLSCSVAVWDAPSNRGSGDQVAEGGGGAYACECFLIYLIKGEYLRLESYSVSPLVKR